MEGADERGEGDRDVKSVHKIALSFVEVEGRLLGEKNADKLNMFTVKDARTPSLHSEGVVGCVFLNVRQSLDVVYGPHHTCH